MVRSRLTPEWQFRPARTSAARLLAGGALLAAIVTSTGGLANDLPGARPGSTLRISVPRLEGVAADLPVLERLNAQAPKAELPPSGAPKVDAPKVETAGIAPPPAVVTPVIIGDIDEAKIRAFLEPLRAKYRLKPEEVAGFVAAYAARAGKPVFVGESNGSYSLSGKIEALARVLASAGADGLDAHRLTAVLPAVRAGAVAADKRVETELASAFAAFLYARDARGGRIEPARLSGLLTPMLALPAPGEVLEALAGAPESGVGGVLARYNPQHAGYQRLKAELAKLNEPAAPVFTGNVAGGAGAPQPEASLPRGFLAGGPLKLGQADPRVPNLRVRLNLPPGTSNIFDAELREALIAFQRANGLSANGVLTPRTRTALEDPETPVNLAAARADKRALKAMLLVNMERWRWLPPELATRHVLVNIPAYELKLIDNGAVVHSARVIVGKPQTQTPVFSDTFAHIIVNPSWFVPPSIMKNEFLPRLASDPSYAARRGFEVVRTRNGISVRQPPGERNALGYVKFIFPNRHSVYLHDTPNRNLFAAETRPFSHGCVRVEKPFALAEKLLSQSGGFSEAQLKGMVGRGERMIKLADKVGVHLNYFTLEVDESGALHHFRDLYGHDARVKSALAL